MNQMTEAARRAGLNVPQNRLVWRWVKDHPASTKREIEAGLKGAVPESGVNYHLRDLFLRGMLKKDVVTRFGRELFGYTVTGDDEDFVLMPRVMEGVHKKEEPKPEPHDYTPPRKETPAREHVHFEIIRADRIRDVMEQIMELPIKDVIQLRDRLNELFGGKNGSGR